MRDITAKSYITGFISSVALTLVAYYLVQAHLLSDHEWPPHPAIIFLVVGLAIAQFLAQLFFFLHLGKKSTPLWNTAVFVFALCIVVIVVGGSLWIMYNLNYNMTSAIDVNAYLQHEN